MFTKRCHTLNFTWSLELAVVSWWEYVGECECCGEPHRAWLRHGKHVDHTHCVVVHKLTQHQSHNLHRHTRTAVLQHLHHKTQHGKYCLQHRNCFTSIYCIWNLSSEEQRQRDWGKEFPKSNLNLFNFVLHVPPSKSLFSLHFQCSSWCFLCLLFIIIFLMISTLHTMPFVESGASGNYAGSGNDVTLELTAFQYWKTGKLALFWAG